LISGIEILRFPGNEVEHLPITEQPLNQSRPAALYLLVAGHRPGALSWSELCPEGVLVERSTKVRTAETVRTLSPKYSTKNHE
jgi:hypothetical protein